MYTMRFQQPARHGLKRMARRRAFGVTGTPVMFIAFKLRAGIPRLFLRFAGSGQTIATCAPEAQPGARGSIGCSSTSIFPQLFEHREFGGEATQIHPYRASTPARYAAVAHQGR
jgi:hypothetical protein